jgi:hypothetical protein
VPNHSVWLLDPEVEGEVLGGGFAVFGGGLEGDVADAERALDALGPFEQGVDGEELDARVFRAVG